MKYVIEREEIINSETRVRVCTFYGNEEKMIQFFESTFRLCREYTRQVAEGSDSIEGVYKKWWEKLMNTCKQFVRPDMSAFREFVSYMMLLVNNNAPPDSELWHTVFPLWSTALVVLIISMSLGEDGFYPGFNSDWMELVKEHEKKSSLSEIELARISEPGLHWFSGICKRIKNIPLSFEEQAKNEKLPDRPSQSPEIAIGFISYLLASQEPPETDYKFFVRWLNLAEKKGVTKDELPQWVGVCVRKFLAEKNPKIEFFASQFLSKNASLCVIRFLAVKENCFEIPQQIFTPTRFLIRRVFSLPCGPSKRPYHKFSDLELLSKFQERSRIDPPVIPPLLSQFTGGLDSKYKVALKGGLVFPEMVVELLWYLTHFHKNFDISFYVDWKKQLNLFKCDIDVFEWVRESTEEILYVAIPEITPKMAENMGLIVWVTVKMLERAYLCFNEEHVSELVTMLQIVRTVFCVKYSDHKICIINSEKEVLKGFSVKSPTKQSAEEISMKKFAEPGFKWFKNINERVRNDWTILDENSFEMLDSYRKIKSEDLSNMYLPRYLLGYILGSTNSFDVDFMFYLSWLNYSEKSKGRLTLSQWITNSSLLAVAQENRTVIQPFMGVLTLVLDLCSNRLFQYKTNKFGIPLECIATTKLILKRVLAIPSKTANPIQIFKGLEFLSQLVVRHDFGKQTAGSQTAVTKYPMESLCFPELIVEFLWYATQCGQVFDFSFFIEWYKCLEFIKTSTRIEWIKMATYEIILANCPSIDSSFLENISNETMNFVRYLKTCTDSSGDMFVFEMSVLTGHLDSLRKLFGLKLPGIERVITPQGKTIKAPQTAVNSRLVAETIIINNQLTRVTDWLSGIKDRVTETVDSSYLDTLNRLNQKVPFTDIQTRKLDEFIEYLFNGESDFKISVFREFKSQFPYGYIYHPGLYDVLKAKNPGAPDTMLARVALLFSKLFGPIPVDTGELLIYDWNMWASSMVKFASSVGYNGVRPGKVILGERTIGVIFPTHPDSEEILDVISCKEMMKILDILGNGGSMFVSELENLPFEKLRNQINIQLILRELYPFVNVEKVFDASEYLLCVGFFIRLVIDNIRVNKKINCETTVFSKNLLSLAHSLEWAEDKILPWCIVDKKGKVALKWDKLTIKREPVPTRMEKLKNLNFCYDVRRTQIFLKQPPSAQESKIFKIASEQSGHSLQVLKLLNCMLTDDGIIIMDDFQKAIDLIQSLWNLSPPNKKAMTPAALREWFQISLVKACIDLHVVKEIQIFAQIAFSAGSVAEKLLTYQNERNGELDSLYLELMRLRYLMIPDVFRPCRSLRFGESEIVQLRSIPHDISPEDEFLNAAIELSNQRNAPDSLNSKAVEKAIQAAPINDTPILPPVVVEKTSILPAEVSVLSARLDVLAQENKDLREKLKKGIDTFNNSMNDLTNLLPQASTQHFRALSEKIDKDVSSLQAQIIQLSEAPPPKRVIMEIETQIAKFVLKPDPNFEPAKPVAASTGASKKADKALKQALRQSSLLITEIGTPVFLRSIRDLFSTHPEASENGKAVAVFALLPKSIQDELGHEGDSWNDLEERLLARWSVSAEKAALLEYAASCKQEQGESLNEFFERVCALANNLDSFKPTCCFIDGLFNKKVRRRILDRDPKAKEEMTVYEALIAARYVTEELKDTSTKKDEGMMELFKRIASLEEKVDRATPKNDEETRPKPTVRCWKDAAEKPCKFRLCTFKHLLPENVSIRQQWALE